MPNMSLTKVVMPEQEPDVRNKNFEEVALGYTKEMAMEEATRCLNCKHQPCKQGCPVGVPIPEFIQEVAAGNMEEAYKIITSENALPAICGRVCPQENQCEGKCVRGIKGEAVGIGRLERFVADYHMANGKAPELDIKSNGIKVAIIGSGPAGITCAGELAKKGYEVTVFEALHKTGGVLSYVITEFLVPKALVQKEVDSVAALGVKFETNVVVGRSITIDELQEQGYQGIFIGLEVGLIGDGFNAIGIETSAFGVFLNTIPYRFYNILILGFIVLTTILLKDFGPMKEAELRARRGQVNSSSNKEIDEKISNEHSDLEPLPGVKLNIWNAIIPIGILKA